MKKNNLLLTGLVLAITIGFSSCEATEEVVCNTDAAYDAYLSSVSKFSNNPTKSNCNNMKSKARDFISKAGACGGIDTSAAQRSINSIDCSDF
ncbi:hypothetical protein [uncultured Polaribacter sp.]|uniref:hypothetical protein n=1 Tax=uncultured Polaribacter sp. TaxID=174711 RepID=UPI002610121B|nr:hypothetical protein [uncultured Polaribacter sp.]